MKKIVENTIIMMLILGLCLSFTSIVSADDPTYDDITVDPAEPERLSEVTFTVDVTGENVEEVYIKVEECNDILCYQDIQNVSMTNTEGSTWECSVTLIHDDTTYSSIWLIIKNDDGTWYELSDLKQEVTVVESSTGDGDGDGDGDNGNGDNGGGGIPGFELIFALVSIAVVLFIYKRNR